MAVGADCRALSSRRWRVLPPWKVGVCVIERERGLGDCEVKVQRRRLV